MKWKLKSEVEYLVACDAMVPLIAKRITFEEAAIKIEGIYKERYDTAEADLIAALDLLEEARHRLLYNKNSVLAHTITSFLKQFKPNDNE